MNTYLAVYTRCTPVSEYRNVEKTEPEYHAITAHNLGEAECRATLLEIAINTQLEHTPVYSSRIKLESIELVY